MSSPTAVPSIEGSCQLSSESGSAERSASLMHQALTTRGVCVLVVCMRACVHVCMSVCVRVYVHACMHGAQGTIEQCLRILSVILLLFHLSLSLRMFDSSFL